MIQKRILSKVRPRARHVQEVIHAVTRAVVQTEFPDADLDGRDSPDRAALDDTVDILMSKLDLMPGYLSLGMVVATALLDRAAMAGSGKPFHGLPPAQQQARFSALQRSPVALLRDFTDFYTKMGVFVYCSQLEARDPARYGADKVRG